MANSLLVICNAAILGFMTFFVVVVSPTVFKSLPQEHAASFLRILFPKMFKFGLFVSGICLLVSLKEESTIIVFCSTFLVVSFVINCFILTPQINKARDQFLAGQKKKNRLFRNLHFASVVIFIIQFGISSFSILFLLKII